MGDLTYFQTFFAFLITLFTAIQKILSMNFGTYVDMPAGATLWLSSFENSIGNIGNPAYLKLKDVKGLSTFFENVQLTMIYGFWFLNQYIILVIMLNFLISVIGETYAKV